MILLFTGLLVSLCIMTGLQFSSSSGNLWSKSIGGAASSTTRQQGRLRQLDYAAPAPTPPIEVAAAANNGDGPAHKIRLDHAASPPKTSLVPGRETIFQLAHRLGTDKARPLHS